MSNSRHNDTVARRAQKTPHLALCLQASWTALGCVGLFKLPRGIYLVNLLQGNRRLRLTKHRTLIIPTCHSLLMSPFHIAHRGDESKGGWKVSFGRPSREWLRRTRVAEKGVHTCLSTKAHYSPHALTSCLVVMEAAAMGSRGLFRTVNENPPVSNLCLFSAPVYPLFSFLPSFRNI